MDLLLDDYLGRIHGRKSLIIEESLAGPLSLAVDINALIKRHAIESVVWVDSHVTPTSTALGSATAHTAVYLVRPSQSMLELVAQLVKSRPQTFHTLLLVPRITHLSTHRLTSLGITGDVQVEDFPLGASWITLENDLISLERADDTIRRIWLEGDDTPLWDSAMALESWERVHGSFPRVFGKGDAAQRLIDLLDQRRQSGTGSASSSMTNTSVDGLVVIDRSTDWITPLMTQLTYTGLLDEHLGIHHAHVRNTKEKTSYHLSTASDPLLHSIRDLNFSDLGPTLASIATDLSASFARKDSLASVGEIKAFVQGIGGLKGAKQALGVHTDWAERLLVLVGKESFTRVLDIQQNIITGYDLSSQLSAIQDLVYTTEYPATTILRLVILLSLVSSGIRSKSLDAFQHDFLETYGSHYLPLFIHLESLGLLVRSPNQHHRPSAIQSSYNSIKKSFRLWVDETDERAMNDVSYVHSGYAPLSVRIAQCLVQKPGVLASSPSSSTTKPTAHDLSKGWSGFEDALALLPGPLVHKSYVSKTSSTDKSASPRDSTTTTVIFFLGGCTYTEIAAVRWLNRQATGRRYVIATTGVINGNTMVKELEGIEPPERRKRGVGPFAL